MSSPTSSNASRSAVERAILAYFEHLGKGHKSALEPFMDGLQESERAEVRELVLGTRKLEHHLPRALAPDGVIARRYRIRAELGHGGMGRVFSAHDEQLDRLVAVKVMHSLDQGREDREELFQRESRLLAALQHPGIVGVHEFGRDGDLEYIVMDQVVGTNLADVLTRARSRLEALAGPDRARARRGSLLTECIGQAPAPGREDLIQPGNWFGSLARILVQVARTLEAAHEQGVVHRDLKPSNVMLQGGGIPVLLDFGLAGRREGSGGAITEGFYGSLGYLAPEQVQSLRSGADVRSDVYQLGLILYECLTLQRAFPDGELGDLLERIREGRFPTPQSLEPEVPLELEAICLAALELAPERRYPTAAALRVDLELWLADETPRALHSHRWRRTRAAIARSLRRHPWPTAVLSMVAIASLAFGLWSVLRPEVATRVAFQRFVIDPDGTREARFEPLSAATELCAAETLVAEIEPPGPLRVWALSLMGTERDLQVEAVYALTLQEYQGLGQLSDSFLRERVREGVEIEAGLQRLFCTRVDSEATFSHEGLALVLASSECPEIELVFEGFAHSSEKLQTTLALQDFMGFIDELAQTTRGGRLRAPDANEVLDIQKALTGVESKIELPWPGTELHMIRLPVRPLDPTGKR